jgi:protocatechuate 3,4-dioxygenase beta subunit
VKNDNISLQRRHLMIAGLAGLAAPAGVFAGSATQGALEIAMRPLVVSGRVVDPAGKPLAGAIVAASRVNTTTDADGRFVFTTVAGTVRNGYPQSLACRVSHPAHRTLENRIEFGRASIQRDEAGAWRAAVRLRLA